MQDSIEDYLRISKSIKGSSGDENGSISKELLATTQRKKEYEAYAIKIVMFLLDGKLRPEIFLKCLKYINQEYYQDVVEERAITKLCGYPLCGKKMADMPKQRYIISTKANKVYDISERKNFCSNFCYKASLYIKEQIDSSPLWLRNHKEMNDCNLLPASVLGSPGEEIDQGITKPTTELPQFTSVAQFTQCSLEEVGEKERTPKSSGKINVKHTIQKQKCLNVIKEDDKSDSENELENNYVEFQEGGNDEISKLIKQKNIDVQQKEDLKACASKEIVNVNNTKDKKEKIVGKQNAKHENEKLEYLISKLKIKNEPKIKLVEPLLKVSQKNNIVVQDQQLGNSSETIKTLRHSVSLENNQKEVKNYSLSHVSYDEIFENVKISVYEWITLETFIYIYGEDKVKQILDENKMGEYFDKLKLTELDRTKQLKYMDICRRLHMKELAEEKFDNGVLGYASKPLPDFKQLKTEVQELDLKVKSFYKGVLYEKSDANFPCKPIKENEINEDGILNLPLVDVNAQTSLRRKVFLNSINKVLMKLIRELKLEESKIQPSIQELVKTFKLQAHNIVFKPAGWSLVAVILIKIISLKDSDVDKQLKDQNSIEQLNLILSRYSGVEEFMEYVFTILSDVDKFVECYITQQTKT